MEFGKEATKQGGVDSLQDWWCTDGGDGGYGNLGHSGEVAKERDDGGERGRDND